jgi:predicted RNA methylase
MRESWLNQIHRCCKLISSPAYAAKAWFLPVPTVGGILERVLEREIQLKIQNDVLAVLSAAETTGNELRLVGQLDRKMYVRVNDVLEAAGGKWNKKAKAHIFETDAAERIDEIILTGEVEKPKDEFNYFPTPPEIVAHLLELTGIEKGMHVLEPSAGQGAIAIPFYEAGALVDVVELNDKNADVLISKGFDVLARDFLNVATFNQLYDRIVMNPPFMKQQDIKHVNHAHKFLKADGILFAIMSAGVKFRSNKLTEEFRKFVDSKGGSIEDLPEGSFKHSGTMVNTVVVTIPA